MSVVRCRPILWCRGSCGSREAGYIQDGRQGGRLHTGWQAGRLATYRLAGREAGARPMLPAPLIGSKSALPVFWQELSARQWVSQSVPC